MERRIKGEQNVRAGCHRLPSASPSQPHPCDLAAAAKSLQSCLTLCDPIDSSPPGSPVPGILQVGSGGETGIEEGNGRGYQLCPCGCLPTAAILDDPMECSRGERLSITLAKNRINRAPERLGKAKVEVDIFELLRDSEYETAETST